MKSAHHVLVVDDHRLMREAVAALVRELEPTARVSMAGSVQQALALCAREDLDSAVLDLQLPDGSGEQVLAALHRRKPALPVLVITASDAPGDAARLIGRGAWGCCAKASGHDALAAALRRVITGLPWLPAAAGARSAHAATLSPEQFQVLGLLCEGLRNPDIGARLGLSEETTRRQVAAIFRALKVHNRSQAAAVARAEGLVNSYTEAWDSRSAPPPTQ